jgi:hypothetical protein
MKYIVDHISTWNLRHHLDFNPHPGYRLVGCTHQNEREAILVWECDDANTGNTTLLNACKKAYRKHVMDDPDIGWTEVGNELGEALAEVMGDVEFNRWSEKTAKDKTV